MTTEDAIQSIKALKENKSYSQFERIKILQEVIMFLLEERLKELQENG